MRVWEWLGTTDADQVLEVPRHDVGQIRRGNGELSGPPGVRTDEGAPQRLAALTAAFHTPTTPPLAWIWRRPEPGAPVEIIAAGAAPVPPGAGTSSLRNGELRTRLTRLQKWTSVSVRHDGLLDNTDGERRLSGPPGALSASLESVLLGVWEAPFAVAVLATRVPVPEFLPVISEVADSARQSRSRAESSPDHAVAHDRARAWHRELRSAESYGLWRVRLVVGGADEVAARSLAGLVVASIDLDGHSYTLVPGPDCGSLDAVLAVEDGDLAGSRLLAALTRPPATEVPGVRLTLPSGFDVTPERIADPEHDASGARTGVRLGDVLDRQRRVAGAVSLPLGSLNRHTFVCGATGAGKSQTVRALLEQASAAGVPWLVVEPANATGTHGTVACGHGARTGEGPAVPDTG
ncbi:helicase HerA-like domain-containing protein [Actinopolymorpha pittospori]